MASGSQKKRRKPKALRKEVQIRLRVTAEQKEEFLDAANRRGLDISGWLRMLGVEEVTRLRSGTRPKAEGDAPSATGENSGAAAEEPGRRQGGN